MKMYAQCRECGHEFEDTFGGISVGPGAVGVTFEGAMTRCPRCGGDARYMEGRFAGSVGAPILLDGPQWTREMLARMTPAQARRLRNAVDWAQSASSSPDADEEAIKAKVARVVEKEAPWLQRFLDVALGQRAANLVQILGFIMIVLAFFGHAPGEQATPPHPGITEDQLREMFDEYVGGGSGTPPLPTPGPEEPTPEP